MSGLKQDIAWRSILMLERRRLGANHQATERCIGFFAGIANTRHLSAPQYRTGRAKLSNFVQLVADVKEAATFADEFLQDHKKFFYGLRC